MTTRRPARRYFLSAIGAALAAPIGSVAPGTASAADAFTMRLSHTGALNTVTDQTARHFASAVNARSNGQLTIEVYPNGQLVKEQETINGLATGLIDLGIQPSTVLETSFPQCQVFDLPFLFKDTATAERVLAGPIGNEIFAAFEAKGITGLCYGIGGFKQIETTTKPIVVPEDLKGLRVRILGGPIYSAAYQALGAIPVTIDASELFNAFQQHTVDGTEILIDPFTTGKFYTVLKHVAMTNSTVAIYPLLASKRKVDALPRPLQDALKQEGRALVPFWRSLVARQTADDIEILKKNGVAFSEVQRPAFRRAVEPVYAMAESKLGNLLERIEKAS